MRKYWPCGRELWAVQLIPRSSVIRSGVLCVFLPMYFRISFTQAYSPGDQMYEPCSNVASPSLLAITPFGRNCGVAEFTPHRALGLEFALSFWCEGFVLRSIGVNVEDWRIRLAPLIICNYKACAARR